MSLALAFFDMERDRRFEHLARRSRVPLLWDLERYTGKLAEAAPAFANRWKSLWSWRRFPHWSKILLLLAWDHSAPGVGVPNPHRDHRGVTRREDLPRDLSGK